MRATHDDHDATGRGHGAPTAGLVDSSTWIALFSARDRHHEEIERAFGAAAGTSVRLVTTSLVLSEVHRFQLVHAGVAAADRDFAIAGFDVWQPPRGGRER